MVLQVTAASQLLVFTIGFTHVDHFHPGCKVARPNVIPSNVTSSNWPLSNERFSSGSDKVFFFHLCHAADPKLMHGIRQAGILSVSVYLSQNFSIHHFAKAILR